MTPGAPVSRMRRNGFQRPFHTLQLISWVVFGFLGLSFHLFLLPALSTSSWWHRLSVALGYWCAAGPMLLFVVRTTRSEPLDQHVIDARIARSALLPATEPKPSVYDYPLETETVHQREQRRLDPTQQQLALAGGGDGSSTARSQSRHSHIAPAQKNWCPYCHEHVNPTSKHCRLCDKCVSDFDHHCKWLNTCIGGRNYSMFFVSMTSALGVLGYQLGLSLYLFIQTFLKEYEGLSPGDNIRSAYGAFHPVLFQVIMGFNILLTTPLFLSLLQLFGLHVYLWHRQITTYEWIMERRAQLAEMEQRQAAAAKEQAAKAQQQPMNGAAASHTIEMSKTQQQQQQPLSARRHQQQSQQHSPRPGVTLVAAKQQAVEPSSSHEMHNPLASPTGFPPPSATPVNGATPTGYPEYETPGNPDAADYSVQSPSSRPHSHHHQRGIGSEALSMARVHTVTVTAANVHLTSMGGTGGPPHHHLHAYSADHARSLPPRELDNDSPSLTESQQADSLFQHQLLHTHSSHHPTNGSLLASAGAGASAAAAAIAGRHSLNQWSRAPSGLGGQTLPPVTLHLAGSGIGVSGAVIRPQHSSLSLSRGSPLVQPAASGRQLPPLQQVPRTGDESLQSPSVPLMSPSAVNLSLSPPRGATAAGLPGQINEHSPLPARSAATLSPTHSGATATDTSLPPTPTAQAYATAVAAHIAAPLPPPSMPTATEPPAPLVVATKNGRSMEDEAAAFLADPKATEPYFASQQQRRR